MRHSVVYEGLRCELARLSKLPGNRNALASLPRAHVFFGHKRVSGAETLYDDFDPGGGRMCDVFVGHQMNLLFILFQTGLAGRGVAE